jgi:arylsulfatase A-like enzyme
MPGSRRGAALALLPGLLILAGATAGCAPAQEEPGAGATAPESVPAQARQAGSGTREAAPLVILISIDTLRPDHLGLYGHERFTSPILDGLAAESTVFDDASSTAPWTLPAHASLLTGLHPLEHRVVTAGNKLPDDVPTIAAMLRARGFWTAAVVNSTWLRQTTYALTRDFDEFLWVQENPTQRSPSTWVTDQAIDWLGDLDGRPSFLFVHYYDVHSDYAALPSYERLFVTPYQGEADGTSWQLAIAGFPSEFLDFCAREFAPEYCKRSLPNERRVIDASTERVEFDESDIRHLEQLYDAGIRQLDAELGRLFSFLRGSGLMEQTLLIVTSDHGEEFMEHGNVEHSRSQYQEMLRVPLLVRGPGVARGLRVSAPVSLIDIAPTILAFLGSSPPQRLDGLDLAPLWSDGETAAFWERFLYGEASRGLGWAALGFEDIFAVHRSVRRGRYKLYYESHGPTLKLFDLEADPAESADISPQQPEVAAQLSEHLRSRYQGLDPGSHGPKVELDEEDAERLRALGYLN